MSATWYFCRACGYRGRFIAEPDREVECPKCHDHGRDKAIMRRQDVAWLKKAKGECDACRAD